MIPSDRISIRRLILSLTEAMDLVCPEIAGHQHRVTYIALRLAGRLGFSRVEMDQLFLASALHDVGLVGVKDRKQYLVGNIPERADWHGEAGYRLLRSSALFTEAAEMVRYHHMDWGDGLGEFSNGRAVPKASHIIHLADSVDLAIERDRHVLEQTGGILKALDNDGGERFAPDCVAALKQLADQEAFWLDCTSPRIYSLLLEVIDDTLLDLNGRNIDQIAEVFARIVDVTSRWTATHSAGVADAAVALAKRLHFSPRELDYMRIAGLLHDVGKLAVPLEILEGADRPDPKGWAHLKAHTYHTYRILESAGFPREIIEWAAFHHERIDGQGYPFRVLGENLSLGARIMAVADTYSALTEDRPYRKEPFSPEQVLAALKRMVKNGALDGRVVSLLNDYPWGIKKTASSPKNDFVPAESG